MYHLNIWLKMFNYWKKITDRMLNVAVGFTFVANVLPTTLVGWYLGMTRK